MNAIKKLIFIFLSVSFIFSFSSCSSDDEDEATPSPTPTSTPTTNTPSNNVSLTSNQLVGTWEMTSLDYAGTSTTNQFGVTYTTSFTGLGINFTYTITYNDNPKTYTTTGGYTVALTNIVNGISSTQNVTIPDVPGSGTWELNGNMLTVVDDATNESNTTEILAASNTTYSVDFAGLFGKSLGGADVKFSSGQITYKKK